MLIKLNRKFLPKYNILKEWELLLFFLLLFVYNVVLLKIQFLVISIFLIIGLLAISLFISKRIAVGTKCLFYENKVVYKFDFLFIHIKKVVKYTDIKDIVYNQRFLQKKFGLGNIVVIPKSRGIIFKGFEIMDISNVEDIFKKFLPAVHHEMTVVEL